MSRRPLLRPNWPLQRTVSDTVVKNLLPVDVFSHVFGHVFRLTWLLLLILGWHEAKNDGHPFCKTTCCIGSSITFADLMKCNPSTASYQESAPILIFLIPMRIGLVTERNLPVDDSLDGLSD